MRMLGRRGDVTLNQEEAGVYDQARSGEPVLADLKRPDGVSTPKK